MRAVVLVEPTGPAQPISDDPIDVHEHGVAPRHRMTLEQPTTWSGSEWAAFAGKGRRLVRLPRRLSPKRSPTRRERREARRAGERVQPGPMLDAADVARWVRGEPPPANLPFHPTSYSGPAVDVDGRPVLVGVVEQVMRANRLLDIPMLWELAFPRRGLGRPKALRRRRPPRRPLTLHDLRLRAAERWAAGHRGDVDIDLDRLEAFEVRRDPEFQLLAMDFAADSPELPEHCFAIVAGMRLFIRPPLAERFMQAAARMGTEAARALNERIRERLYSPYRPPEREEVSVSPTTAIAEVFAQQQRTADRLDAARAVFRENLEQAAQRLGITVGLVDFNLRGDGSASGTLILHRPLTAPRVPPLLLDIDPETGLPRW